MKKIFLLTILFSVGLVARSQSFYIQQVDTSNGVENHHYVDISVEDSLIIDNLDLLANFSYINVNDTVTLNAGGCMTSYHHVKVNGTATLLFDDIHNNSTIYLLLEQDATGGYTINLPTFDNLDTQPTVSTVANKMDVLIITKFGELLYLNSYVRYNDTF